MKKTLFFDFDGVIADTFHIAFEVAKMDKPTLTIESYRDKWKTNISKAVFTEPKIDVEVDFQKEFAKQMEHLVLSADKKQVLQDLSETYDFHIISSTNTETIAKFCERNDIRHYFGDILGYDVAASKIEKFGTLFKKYNLIPKDIIFITDTVGDIEEAQEVGIGTIVAVADGYQDKAVLATAHPTYLVSSILELGKII